jgi:hypothetical protein
MCTEAGAANACVTVAFRKTRDAPFVIPTDHLLFPLGSVVAAELRGNFDQCAAARPVAQAHALRPSATVAASLASIVKFTAWKVGVTVWLGLKRLIPCR